MTMNHTMETILGRRAIRSYRTERIPEEELSELLKAAKFAPSTMGLQARHFTVIQNKKLMDDIVAATTKNGGGFVPGHIPFYNAPAIIVFSAPARAKFGREDAACAVMDLMLAAYSRGLGSCYICSVLPGLRDEEILKRLDLPHGYVPLGCVSVGYPDGSAPVPKERRGDDVNYIR